MPSSSAPKLLHAGLVLLDPGSSAVKRVIALQYNPDSLSRTLQVQGASEGGDRSEALRFKGPAVETIKIECEIDATDPVGITERQKGAGSVEVGIQRIDALEGHLLAVRQAQRRVELAALEQRPEDAQRRRPGAETDAGAGLGQRLGDRESEAAIVGDTGDQSALAAQIDAQHAGVSTTTP